MFNFKSRISMSDLVSCSKASIAASEGIHSPAIQTGGLVP